MPIPRRLIRTVPADTPPEVDAWWTEWLGLHLGWEFETFRDPIDPDRFPQTAPHWARCTSGAQRAGLVRLEALATTGGIYLDSDVQPLGRSLEPLIACRAFAAWEDTTVIPDAVIGAEPGHPAIVQALRSAIVQLPRGAWYSGPGVTTETFKGRRDVLLLPPDSFYGVGWRDGLNHSNDAGLDAFAADPPPWSFGLHRWHASWVDGS